MRLLNKIIGGGKYLLPLVFVTIINFSWAQQIRHAPEIGLAVGVANYTGDLAQTYNMRLHNPGVNLFYKHNYPGNVSILRANLLVARLAADESKFDQPLQQARAESFETIFMEAALLYEYNFFNFRDDKGMYFMAPYLFGGLAAVVLWEGSNPVYGAIPFGVGTKLMISRHFNIGIEFGARYVLGDMLDGIDDDAAFNSSTNNDWYYFTGISLSYTFYKTICWRDKLK